MSLRDKLRELENQPINDLYERFGVETNPYPASNQTMGNPHQVSEADAEAEDRVVTFFRDDKSQVVVIQGTQGVGKTNFLNHFEVEIRNALQDRHGYYVVRYLADPEGSFDGTTRRLVEELGTEHLGKLADSLKDDKAPIEEARSHDMRKALRRLLASDDEETRGLMMEWLLGLRLFKAHRLALDVQFRLDTVESKTAALRDLAQVSARAGVLKGIFLLLDEIEKQDGVLGPKAVVRYLSALRAMVDALPRCLFLMIAATPDALNRYSYAYPALRSRLENHIELRPLGDDQDAHDLAKFYLQTARRKAQQTRNTKGGERPIIKSSEIQDCFRDMQDQAQRRGDEGVRQREFLHRLHRMAEDRLKMNHRPQ